MVTVVTGLTGVIEATGGTVVTGVTGMTKVIGVTRLLILARGLLLVQEMLAHLKTPCILNLNLLTRPKLLLNYSFYLFICPL